MTDFIDSFMWGFITGGIVSVIVFVSFVGLENHPVDMEEFGSRLCGSQDLVYDHFETPSSRFVPVIYCVENKATSVYDGVVVQVQQ